MNPLHVWRVVITYLLRPTPPPNRTERRARATTTTKDQTWTFVLDAMEAAA